jgi:hypothetical protein
MGKNKEKAPKIEAPVVEKPESEEVATTTVVDINATKGLSQHDKLQFATELRHRVSELKEEDNPPLALISGYNMIRDITFIDLAAGEIACGQSATGYIFSGNETAYKVLQMAATSLGVALQDFKTLPAPSKKQLEEVGLSSVGNTKLITISSDNVSAETKKKKKEEKKVIDESKNKDYMKDHTKIETDEQLKEALGFQLVNPQITNPIERLVTTAIFYRSYLEARSDKAEDPNAELERIHALTKADLLSEIVTMVPPTFVAKGFGDLLGRRAHDANSIVPAFCMLKNCVTDRKTGVQKYSDEEIAALVRILIAWYVSNKSAEMSEAIKAKEENIKVLKKDEKANAKGIETEEKKIAGLKKSIEHFNGMLSLATDPSFDIADNFIAAYNNKEDAMHLSATQIASVITETYYRGVDIPELEFDSVLLNIQQHTGIILNLFSSPIAKRDEYDESNLIVFNESKPEENNEDEPKN